MSTKMLSAPARTRSLLPSLSHSPLQPIFRRLNLLIHRRNNHHTPIKMSSGPQQIVEHVVLFKVKPDVDSTKVSAMINGLNGLSSLNLTLHLSAGEILKSRSSAMSFTHILHSRYKSKEDLRTYGGHPEHVRVVTENIKPIIDDIMAVDWIYNNSAASPKAGSAMRVTFLKLKENLGEKEKDKVLDVIGELKNQFNKIEELSVGENFSHERAKGFTIASIAVLPRPSDLVALDSKVEYVNMQKEKVKEFIDSVVVVDYVIPTLKTATASL